MGGGGGGPGVQGRNAELESGAPGNLLPSQGSSFCLAASLNASRKAVTVRPRPPFLIRNLGRCLDPGQKPMTTGFSLPLPLLGWGHGGRVGTWASGQWGPGFKVRLAASRLPALSLFRRHSGELTCRELPDGVRPKPLAAWVKWPP